MATTAQLLGLLSRRQLRSAVKRGDVVRIARGRFRLPDTAEALVSASRVSCALALLPRPAGQAEVRQPGSRGPAG